ncbi:MAG: hypothetical protein SGJ23_02140 [Alphaproteobacteria bacterium]|nr:hypothetical protein [Alphaproteobacteria bacterium]
MVRVILICVCAALAVGGCKPESKTKTGNAPPPVASSADAIIRDPRNWEAVSDDARVATGPLSLFETDYPPATNPQTGAPVGASVVTSVFTSMQGHVLTTIASGAADGETAVLDESRQPTTISARLSVPRDATLTLYRVLDEGPADIAKLCGATRPTAYLVMWRLEDGADMKLMPITGAAPGMPGEMVCDVLDYRGGGAG